MDELKNLGKNIRRLRRSADITQSELGLKIDLSKDSLSKLELGKQENIGLKYLVLICQVLNVDMEALFIKDTRIITPSFSISDGSVRALGEIVKQVQEIMAKYGGKE